VAPSNGSGPVGEFAVRSLRTPAEPVTVVTATDGYRSAQVSWTAAEATSYIVRTENTVTHEESWTATTATTITIPDLPLVLHKFQVYSINAVGEQCPVPSPTVSATPYDIIPI
jgi:hypothetical protein